MGLGVLGRGVSDQVWGVRCHVMPLPSAQHSAACSARCAVLTSVMCCGLCSAGGVALGAGIALLDTPGTNEYGATELRCKVGRHCSSPNGTACMLA